MRNIIPIIMMACVCGAGCADNAIYMTKSRLNNGLIVILPGIEGQSELNESVRRGLLAAHVSQAMPIHSWGRPIPIVGALLNQMDVIGNRLAGAQVARIIVRYQDSHPGCPVHVIGHSGGGGIAVFAAEAMPPDRKLDGVVLLSASISSAYDLTKALDHCRNGIVSFYSRQDAGLLVIGTILAGNMDGTHGPAAGAIGFDRPRPDAEDAKKLAYLKLYEVQVTEQMTNGSSAHSASTRISFVTAHVAPWVTASTWPATPGAMYAHPTPEPKGSPAGLSATLGAVEPACRQAGESNRRQGLASIDN